MMLAHLRKLAQAAPEKRRLAREGAWVAMGSIVKAVAMIGGVRLLTEVLPRDVYGATNLILGGVMLAFNVLAYPLLQATTRLYPEAETHRTIHALRGLILKVLLAGTTLVLAGAGIWLLLAVSPQTLRGSPMLVFLTLAVILLFQAFMAAEMALLRAARRQKAASLWAAGTAGLRPLAAAGLVVLFGATAHAALGGYALVLAGTTMLTLTLRRPWPPDRAHSEDDETLPRLRREIVAYGLPLVPVLAMSWVLTVSDRYIIAWQAGAQATGLYAAAYGLITSPFIMCQGILSATLRPVYHRAISSGNRSLERRAYGTWFLATFLVCLGGLGATLILAPWVGRIFLAAEYRSATAFMPWLALGAALQALSQVVESILYGHKRTALLPVGYLFTALFCLAVTFALVRRHGPLGAAWAYCLTYGMHLTIFAILARIALRRKRHSKHTT